jgi:glycosyltransferase involved in cell wall biosynthesis
MNPVTKLDSTETDDKFRDISPRPGTLTMQRPKVVHLTSAHLPYDPRIFHRECRSLAQAGFDVTIIAADWPTEERDCVQVKSIKRNSSRLGRMTHTVWKIYREARKQHADVYHFHEPELIPVGLLLRAGGKDVIYDIHEDYPKEMLSKRYLPGWSRELVSWAIATLENVAGRRFSALVVVTPSIADRFQKLNLRTVMVCNYLAARELVREDNKITWESRRQSVGYVGGLMLQRGVCQMVEAMALLPGSLPATLEFAGPEIEGDANFAELKQHPGWQRVKHYGLIDRKSTFQMLQSIRAGLVLYHPEPNQIESMPQKLFEYMGAGIPLIASDFPLWRRIIGDAGCGLFVNPLKPGEIAKAIEYVLTHPREAEEMGRRGQAAVLKQFNWDTEAEKLVHLYSTLKN